MGKQRPKGYYEIRRSLDVLFDKLLLLNVISVDTYMKTYSLYLNEQHMLSLLKTRGRFRYE